MSIDHNLARPDPIVLDADGGEYFEFLNNLANVRLTGAHSGSMSVVEFLAPQGFGPPEHIHRDEDEIFVILDGQLAFLTGGDRFEGGPGGFAFLPRAVPHTFQVLTGTARFVNVTASPTTPPRFDEMVSTLGSATDRRDLPETRPVDPGHVAEVCAAHGIDIVGPPPASLA